MCYTKCGDNMEIVFIPIEEELMMAELTIPDGAGPFRTLVWIADPQGNETMPEYESILLIRRPSDHPLWFAAICDELRLQDFYPDVVDLRVDLPVFPFKYVSHPFGSVTGIYAKDILSTFPQSGRS